ncbi:hypothetical protein FRC02_010446 [Tulasnella sp. 418]|nr:hypothetical protein FRC02_010446 [Tulasnella sp. 418]
MLTLCLAAATHSEISVQGDNKQESHVVNLDSEFPSLETPGELPSRDPTALGHGRTSLLAARSRAISLFEKNYGEISFPSGEVESSTPMKPSLEPRRPSSSAARTRTISNPIHQLGNRSPSSPTGSVSSHHSSTSASLDPATILKEYERERNWNAPRPLSYHSTHSLPIRRLSATSEQSDSGITPRRTRERSDSNGSTTSSLAYGAHGGTPSPSGSIGVSRSVSFSRKGKERARESFPSIDEQIGRISRPTSPMPQLGRATTSPHATSVTGSPRSPRALSAMGSLSRNRTISTPNATAAEVARDRERNWNSPRPTSMYSIPPESTTPPHVHTRTTSLFGIGGLLQGSKDKEDKEKSAEDYSARHGLKRNNTTGRTRVESEHTPFGAGLKPSPSLFAKKETSRPASPDPSNVDNTSRSSLTRSSSSSNKIKTFVGNVTDAFKRSPKKEKEKKGIAAGLVTATSLGRDVLGHGNGDSPGETPPSSPERAKKKNAASAVGSALKDTFLRRNRTNSSLQSGTSSGGAKDTESEAESSAENGASGAVRDSGVDFGDLDKGQAEEVKQKMKEMSEEEERRRKIEQREQEEFEERRMMRMREKEKEEDWERKKKDREERQRLEEEQREFEEEELRRQQQRQSNISRIPLPKVSTPRRTDIDESRLSRALGGSTTPSGTPPRPISISTSSAGNPALEAAKAEESVISLDSPPLTPPPAVSQSVAISPPREELSTIEESREVVEDRPKRRENEVDLGDESDFEAITMEEASEVAGAPLSPQMSPRQEVMETPPRPKWHRPKEPPTPPSPSVELPPLPSDDDALSGDNMSLNSSPVRSGPANGNGHAHGVGENKKLFQCLPRLPSSLVPLICPLSLHLLRRISNSWLRWTLLVTTRLQKRRLSKRRTCPILMLAKRLLPPSDPSRRANNLQESTYRLQTVCVPCRLLNLLHS